MKHTTESKEIDFSIKSKPLTQSERRELSAFIKMRKAELKAKSQTSKYINKKTTAKNV